MKTEVKGREDLILKLRDFPAGQVIQQYLDKDQIRGKTPKEIMDFSFGSNIYRRFAYENPVGRYRKWIWYNKPEELYHQLSRVGSQEEYDEFLFRTSQSLVEGWDETQELQLTAMNNGIALKICNLIMKHMIFSDHNDNSNLKGWLHVPWDRNTLIPIRHIWKGYPRIPSNATQGFVDNLNLYYKLHELITGICREAGVARINYEFWAWDYAHLLY